MKDEKPPRCPVDGENMVAQSHGIGSYHLCPMCRGMWIPRAYLLSLKTRTAQMMKRQPVDPLPPVRHREPLSCPQCTALLLPRLHNSVPVDICAQCRTVWLDSDELLQIAKAVIAEERKSAVVKERDAEHAPGQGSH